MAARYWVGGANTWNSTAGTKWALTSGGTGGQAVPTSSDDVFIDGNSSGNVTVASAYAAQCKSINFTGYTQSFLSGAATASLTVTGGNVVTVAGMTLTFTGPLNLNGASAAYITSGGKVWGNTVAIINASGSWTLQDAFRVTGNLIVNAGSIIANGYNVYCAAVVSTTTSTRVINCGAGSWHLNSATAYSISSATGLSFYQNTSSLYIDYSGASAVNLNLPVAKVPFNGVYITNGTFALTMTNVAANNILNFSGFSGSLAAGFNTSANQIYLSSSMTSSLGFYFTRSGTQYLTSNTMAFGGNVTINAAANVHFLDAFTQTSGNLQVYGTIWNDNNSQINASSIIVTATGNLALNAATMYVTGPLIDISASATLLDNPLNINFANASAVRTINNVSNANVNITANVGISTGTINWNGSQIGSLNVAGINTTFTLTTILKIGGDFNFGNKGSSGSFTTADGWGIEYIQLNNPSSVNVQGNVYISNLNVTTPNVIMNGDLYLGTGNNPGQGAVLYMAGPSMFDTGGYNFSGSIYTQTPAGFTMYLRSGTHTFIMDSSQAVPGIKFFYGGTIYGNTSVARFIANTTLSSGVFSGTAGYAITAAFNNVSFTGLTNFYSNNITCNNLSYLGSNNGALTIYDPNGGTPKLTVSTFTCNGTSGNVINLVSQSTRGSLICASGTISLDYVRINQLDASGGAVFDAGYNSILINNPTGWNYANTSRVTFFTHTVF